MVQTVVPPFDVIVAPDCLLEHGPVCGFSGGAVDPGAGNVLC